MEVTLFRFLFVNIFEQILPLCPTTAQYELTYIALSLTISTKYTKCAKSYRGVDAFAGLYASWNATFKNKTWVQIFYKVRQTHNIWNEMFAHQSPSSRETVVNVWHSCDYSLPGSVGGPGFHWISAPAHILPHFSLLPSHAPTFFSPPLSDHSTRRHSSAHESSHWLEFDSSSQRGDRRGGASHSTEKPFANAERAAWFMLPRNCEKKKKMKKSTLRHNIYTVALFSECTSKREGEEVCAPEGRRRRRRKGGGRDLLPTNATLISVWFPP